MINQRANLASVLKTVDKAPPSSKRAATSPKNKAVADNADSDSGSVALSADDVVDGKE